MKRNAGRQEDVIAFMDETNAGFYLIALYLTDALNYSNTTDTEIQRYEQKQTSLARHDHITGF